MTRNIFFKVFVTQWLLALVLTTSGFGHEWTATSNVQDNNECFLVQHDLQETSAAVFIEEEKQGPIPPEDVPVNKEDNKEDSKEDKFEEDSSEKRGVTNEQYFIAHLDAHQKLKISSFYLHFSYQQVLQPLYILFLAWKSFLI